MDALGLISAGLPLSALRSITTENMARLLAWWVPPPKPKTPPKAKWSCCRCERQRVEGDDSFSRLGFRYCSIACLNAHRETADRLADSGGGDDSGQGGRSGGGGGGGTGWGIAVGSS